MRRAFVPLVVLLGLLAPGALLGQHVPSPYRYLEETHSLGLFGGYLVTEPGDPPQGPQSAPLLGARYSLRLSGPLSGEALVAFAPAERRLFQAPVVGTPEPTEVGRVEMPLLLAEGGLRFSLTGARTWRGLAPYVVGSLGLVTNLRGAEARERTLPNEARFRFGPGLAVGVGGGLEWYATQRLSLQLEARERFWRVVTPGTFRPDGREESDWTPNLGLSAGAAIHF